MNNFIKKTEIIKKITSGEKVIIIDTEKEYIQMAKLLNGKIKNDEITFN